MKKTPKICAMYLGAAMLFAAAPSWAAWYQVEVVVFEHLQPDMDGERWFGNPGLPDRTNSIELIEEAAEGSESEAAPSVGPDAGQAGEGEPLVAFLQLDERAHRLGGVERVLKLSRGYRPLLHVAWQQPGHGPDRSRSVHLELFEEDPAATGAGGEAAPSTDAGFVYSAPETILDGTVRLRVSRFLHVDLDFAFFPADFALLQEAQLGEAAQSPTYMWQRADYVRMRTSRKIKLNELHYFDHPLFGIVLQVSRLRIDSGDEPLEE